MPDIPRRLPPTADERLKVVVSRMAGGSSAGATRWAQPVAPTAYRPAVEGEQPDTTLLSRASCFGIQTGEIHSYDPAEYPDEDYWQDILTMNGLRHGCRYFVEGVLLASFEWEYSTGEGSSGLMAFRVLNDDIVSHVYFEQTQNPIGAPAAGVRRNEFDGPGVFHGFTFPPLGNSGITAIRFHVLIDVPWAQPEATSLLLQYHPELGMMIHPTTYVRATWYADISTAEAS